MSVDSFIVCPCPSLLLLTFDLRSIGDIDQLKLLRCSLLASNLYSLKMGVQSNAMSVNRFDLIWAPATRLVNRV